MQILRRPDPHARSDTRAAVPALPGTYALLLWCDRTAMIDVGRLGELTVRPGFYVYVGSALGPGGLKARIAHHQRLAARPHWHIDCLRAAADVVAMWYTCGQQVLEHCWAERVATMPGAAAPMPRFGASDCRCESHLYYFAARPGATAIRRALVGDATASEHV